MVTKQSALAGKRILVTRPRQQSQSLTQLIQDVGGEAVSFPVIEIAAISAENWHQPQWAEQDWLVFVSRNAVDCFVADLPASLSPAVKYAAVGDGTADALLKQQLPVDLKPAKSTGSEGLLVCAELQQLAGQQITIVRGEGGRELLADTLAARGATISYVEVYRRVLPAVSSQQCEQALSADIVVCTSAAGVTNLCTLLREACESVKTLPLVVLSERIRQHARSLGFKHVSVTADASDKAIMECLMEIK